MPLGPTSTWSISMSGRLSQQTRCICDQYIAGRASRVVVGRGCRTRARVIAPPTRTKVGDPAGWNRRFARIDTKP